MTPQTYARLLRLLPKLGALTDAHRLKVLAQIDRVLLADEHGATWCDIADRLMPPTITGKDLLAMVTAIETAPTAGMLTEAASGFLADMRERAADSDDVYLSARQREWLLQLYHRACVATDPCPVDKPAKSIVAIDTAELSKAMEREPPSGRVH
jgi:hypothetical protein